MIALVVSLVAVPLLAWWLSGPLRRWPMAFYAATLVLDAAYALLVGPGVSPIVVAAFIVPMQRCYFAFALFTVVMFIGVFPQGSTVRQRLAPVRAELSICAALLACAHVARYATSYFGLLFGPGALVGNVQVALGAAALLVVLLAVLTVTSARAVKTRMAARSWKAIQRFAYVFYGLIWAHVVIALWPSAVGGAPSAMAVLAVYTAIMVVYAVARIARALASEDRSRDAVRESDEPALSVG